MKNAYINVLLVMMVTTAAFIKVADAYEAHVSKTIKIEKGE